MGLKGSGPYFQRSMSNTVLTDLVYHICELYIDDVLIHGGDPTTFLANVCMFNVAFNPKKTTLGLEEHWETAVTNFCNFFTKTTTPEKSSRRILCSFVPSQDLKSRFVTICDKIGISNVHLFCAKSVGVTNYFKDLLTNGFTAADVTIGELAKGTGLLVMRSWV